MTASAAVILAAGKSTRMKSDLPKVLHEVCGVPMLAHVITACRDAGIDKLVVVVGHRKDLVIDAFADQPDIEWVEQAEQKGTGHAVMCAEQALRGFRGNVLVIAGDMPLIQRDVLATLLRARAERGDAVTLATTILDEPTGYGRIVRDDEGELTAIVEHRDCTSEQLQIRECNPSYYCFDGARMLDSLSKVTPDNAKGEYYITDAVAILREAGLGVSAIPAVPAEDAMGINTRKDLTEVSCILQYRIQEALLEDAVSIVDLDNTWIEAGTTIGADTVIEPFSFIGAGAQIGAGCRIGPFGHVDRGENVADGSVVGPHQPAGLEA